MTDLVFLLLIFFIILSTRVVNGEEVNLPETSGGAGETGLTLTITKDLRYQVNGTEVAYDDLEARLEATFFGKDPEECQITLNVDKDVPTGNTIEVLGMAREHQWGVTVATKPKRQ
ncbi:MAG: biopolymer transporter ExbD [Flavobacteriales bacterium]|nr:biopolymer transporter ExbD [Flavobacteriales bacterium]